MRASRIFSAASTGSPRKIDEVPATYSLPRDPNDEPYLNLAIAANADYLATWDNDMLDLMEDEGFRLDTPAHHLEPRRPPPGPDITPRTADLTSPTSWRSCRPPARRAGGAQSARADSLRYPDRGQLEPEEVDVPGRAVSQWMYRGLGRVMTAWRVRRIQGG